MARKRKNTEEQMKLFEEGGLKDEGGTVDPVSGNDVPSGSTQAEVRDDIPAQLSEGEFVFPADVVRYIGLENLMELRQKAKSGLSKMEAMGQMGNSEEATISDEEGFESEVDQFIDELDQEDMPQEFAVGGLAGMPSVTDPASQQYAQNMGVAGFLPPGVQAPQVTTPLPTAPTIAPKGGGIPTYEVRKYQGPGGEIRSITFINGEPVQPIPEGYTLYDESQVVEEKTEEPVVSQQDDDNREQEQQRKEQYKDYLNEMNLLSSLSPTFKEYAEETFPGQTKAAQAMVIDPVTGAVSFPGLSLADSVAGLVSGEKFRTITEELKGLGNNKNAFEKAYDEIGEQLGIDPTAEKYQTKTFFGGSFFNKEAFLEDVKEKAVRESVIPDPVTGEITVDPAIRNIIAQEKTRPRKEVPVEQPKLEQPKIEPVNIKGKAYDDYNVTPSVGVQKPEVDMPEVVDTPLGSIYTENGVVKVSTEESMPAERIVEGFDTSKVTQTSPPAGQVRSPFDKVRAPAISRQGADVFDSVAMSRAAAEELTKRSISGDANAEKVQRDFQRELAQQNARIAREKEERESRGESGGLSRGESPSDAPGTPFKQGGLASLKPKTKRKTKMKQGGLASKK